MAAVNPIYVQIKINDDKARELDDALDQAMHGLATLQERVDRLRGAIRGMANDPLVGETATQSDEYHNEDTLHKVLAVLSSLELKNRETSYVYSASEVITMLQNEGILFRERR